MQEAATVTYSTGNIEMSVDAGSVDLDKLGRRITAEWLTTALSQRYPGVAVLQATIVKVVVGFAVKAWVRITFNEAGIRAGLPSIMVVKGAFGDNNNPTILFVNVQEMMSYRDVMPAYPLNAPRCYYAGPGPDGLDSAVVMEDLYAKQVRFCHALTPLGYPEATAFLDVLARFHAKAWRAPVLKDENSALGKSGITAMQGLTAYRESMVGAESWNRHMALPRGATIPSLLRDRDRFIAAYEKLMAFNTTLPYVILHGDEHLGNLYLEKEGTPGFYDLFCYPGPWAQGIAFFLTCALDVVDRRKWDRSLITHYINRLAVHGVDAPSFESAWDAYCKELLYGFFIWTFDGTEYQTEAVITANTARFAMAMIDNDTYGRLGIA